MIKLYEFLAAVVEPTETTMEQKIATKSVGI